VIELCDRVFRQAGLDIFLRPYKILSTGFQSGFIEFLDSAQSVDTVKKQVCGVVWFYGIDEVGSVWCNVM
jgi:phosphatidylinositol kinase/protein kinase (PI-3  family)